METNNEWLKRARAKRIARIQQRRTIDNYIRGRVYMIIIGLFIMIIGFVLALDKISTQHDDMVSLHMTMGELLTKTADDKLLRQNTRLVRALDSLRIMLFAYNRRHQADGKTIQILIDQNNPKSVNNVLKFPNFIDTTKYDFDFDTITGTSIDDEILIKLPKNLGDTMVSNTTISLLDI